MVGGGVTVSPVASGRRSQPQAATGLPVEAARLGGTTSTRSAASPSTVRGCCAGVEVLESVLGAVVTGVDIVTVTIGVGVAPSGSPLQGDQMTTPTSRTRTTALAAHTHQRRGRCDPSGSGCRDDSGRLSTPLPEVLMTVG